MANTYIDTNKLPHTKVPGSGEFVEVLNNALCGAKNVVGSLRWLNSGEKYDAVCDGRTNQLVYLMEGKFFNLIIPGYVGEDFMRGLYAIRTHQGSRSKVIASLRDEFVREIEPPSKRADWRHDDVFDERIDDRPEGRADDHAHC